MGKPRRMRANKHLPDNSYHSKEHEECEIFCHWPPACQYVESPESHTHNLEEVLYGLLVSTSWVTGSVKIRAEKKNGVWRFRIGAGPWAASLDEAAKKRSRVK
jgi:hypothetical protein